MNGPTGRGGRPRTAIIRLSAAGGRPGARFRQKVTRLGVLLLSVAIVAVGSARTTQAQEPGDWIVSVGAGGTLYGIETRFDDGTLLRGGIGYALTPTLMIEGGLRRHGCFDCERFLILDAGLQAHHRGDRFRPFVAAGAGLSSDPGFMGTKWGAHAAVGSWLRLSREWDLQLELRGRQVGVSSSDTMGEFTIGVARRWRRDAQSASSTRARGE